MPHAVAVLPRFQTAYHRVPRQRKTEPRANLCYFLNFGYNHGRDYSKLLDAEIGKKVVFSRVFTWYHPEAPLILPATAVGNPPAVPPEDIYVPIPTPVPIVATPSSALAPVPAHAPEPAPSATPAPASVPTSSSITPPPLTMSTPPVPIPPRVGRKLRHKRYEEMPGRTLGQTRPYAHRHGLLSTMDQEALLSMLVTVSQSMRSFGIIARRRTHRIRKPHMHETFILPCLRQRHRRMRECVGNL